MANEADGSIIIDTQIKSENAIEDIGALKTALKELTTAVKELTSGLANSFTNFGSNAQGAANQMDSISDSAKSAANNVESLEEQMAKITVDHGYQPTYNDNAEVKINNPKVDYIDYGNTVQEFVDRYTAGMDEVENSTNIFKQDINELTTQLKNLESQGLYLGDDQYDEVYRKLTMVKAALADYKKELINPTKGPDINLDTLQGQIDSFRIKLRQLSDQGKTFGDSLYDSTYKSLTESQSKLKDYKKDLVTPVEIPITFDESSFEAQKQRLKSELDELSDQGITFGDVEYDKVYAELQNVINGEKQYKKELSETDREQKKVTRSGTKMNSTLSNTKKQAIPLTKSILKLSNMFKLMIVRMAMRNVIQGVRSGFENLARYSNDTNDAISTLMSSLTKFKNSIAVAFTPILEVVSPILSKFISTLAEVNNYIGQTMAALAGKDSFVKAVAVQEDYAASLSDTQKAAKEAAKEVKKASFAFDTLIQIQKTNNDNGYKGPTPDQMFETKEVSNKAKELAEDVKKNLSDLFKPIQDSWDEYGTTTVSAVQFMLSKLQKLAADIGKSFIKVWKDEGYGKAITDDLIITFGNFALIIANLATQFDKAWVNADTGTSIMRHLGDIVLEITGFFREASKSIMDWAANLDFSPLLTAFDGLLVSLIPIVGKVGSLLLWFLNEILLPLSKWAIEQAIPVTMDLISAALEVLNSVIEALRPLALWLWEEFLKPFGAWAGEIIIAALKKVTEKLKDFSNWINEHKQDILLMTEYVLAFFAAWKVAEFVGKITKIISNMGNLGTALMILVGKLDLTKIAFFGVVGAAAALVVGAFEVFKNWDKMTPAEKVITMLLLAAGAAATLAVATNAITGPAGAALTALAIAAGITAALIAVNASSRSAASSSVSNSSGTRSFSTYSAYSNNIPQLATGTVVPPKAGNFLAMLGDNNKDYEVVSPLETMKQAFKEAIGEMGGMGGGTVKANMIIDSTKFGQLVYKYGNQEDQRVGVRMVVKG